jgi:hypothetical protein
MTDQDERDPFPEASVPETEVPAPAPTIPRGEGAAPLEAPSAAAEANAPVLPSEAPTMPLIPVEKLRYELNPAPEIEAASDIAPPAEAPPAPRPIAPAPQPPAATPAVPATPSGAGPVAARDLLDRREPLYRECRGYRLRLDPPDLARLRELPGSRGKSDDEIGEAFFDGQADRLAESIAGDVPTPSEIRVVVDPYSRQAFLALENRIRGILSF